jgi:cytochrome c biogenesis protein CcmG/thiol:disulfide interchange protein DsbE
VSDSVIETPSAGEQPDQPDVGRSGRPRVAPFIVLIVAVVIAGLFWVLLGADSTPNETADTPLMNRPAPEAIGTLDSGNRFDLSRRKGSWVVLNFFQSSCTPCVQEHPELVRFVDQQRTLPGGGVDFYTVVYDDDRDNVEKFFAENGGGWPIVYDDDGSISVSFGVSKVPETWIIDPSGVVRERIISRTTADFLGTLIGRMQGS